MPTFFQSLQFDPSHEICRMSLEDCSSPKTSSWLSDCDTIVGVIVSKDSPSKSQPFCDCEGHDMWSMCPVLLTPTISMRPSVEETAASDESTDDNVDIVARVLGLLLGARRGTVRTFGRLVYKVDDLCREVRRVWSRLFRAKLKTKQQPV